MSGVVTSAFFLGGGCGVRRCVFTGCFLSSSGAKDSMVVVRSFGFSRYMEISLKLERRACPLSVDLLFDQQTPPLQEELRQLLR